MMMRDVFSCFVNNYQFPAVHRIAGNLCLNRTGLTSFEQWVRFFHVKKE